MFVPDPQDKVCTKGYSVHRRTVCNSCASTKMCGRGPNVNNLTGVQGEKRRGKRGWPLIHHTCKIPPLLFTSNFALLHITLVSTAACSSPKRTVLVQIQGVMPHLTLDMEHIYLSERDFEYFLHILNNPPPPSPRLLRLLTEPSIFDTQEGTLQTLQWLPPHNLMTKP